MANTKIPSELSSTPSISDSGDAIAITIDSSERVLIGTDSGDSFNADSMLRLQRTGDRVFMQFKTDADQNSGILFGDVDDDVECAIEYEPANQALTLSTGNNNEALRIDSSQKVGINCTPHFTFDVQLNSSRRIGFNYSDSQNTILSHDGSGNIETLGLRGNTLLFYTDYDSSNPDGVKRMEIDNAGRYGFNATYPPTSAQFMRIEEELSSNRVMRISNRDNSGGGTTMEIGHADNNEGAHILLCYHGNNVSGSSGDVFLDAVLSLQTNGNLAIDGSFSPNSDRRLKKDITNCSYGLDAINQLIPRTYKGRDVSKEMIGTQIGFIADEVESIIPEVVSKFGLQADGSTLSKTIVGYGDEEGTEETFDQVKNISYERLVVVLTKALQEADTKIEDLKARIETLEG